MSNFVSAYTDDESNVVVSVSEAFAESAGLHTLKEPATDKRGRPLPPREGHRNTSATPATNTTTGGASASKPEESR